MLRCSIWVNFSFEGAIANVDAHALALYLIENLDRGAYQMGVHSDTLNWELMMIHLVEA